VKSLSPAEVKAEPATVKGATFLEAAGRRCLWPLSGSGALMVVCGAERTPGSAYCKPHKHRASSLRVYPD
jgi:hypothetical protein